MFLGSSTDSQLTKRIRTQTLITGSILAANIIGVAVAMVLVTVGIPVPSVFQPGLWWVNFIVVPAYVVFALAVGVTVGTFTVTRDLRWAIRGELPTAHDAVVSRRAPGRLMRLQSTLWIGAMVLFTLLYARYDVRLIPKILIVLGFSGAVVVGISSLFVEFSMRPVEAELIAAGTPAGAVDDCAAARSRHGRSGRASPSSGSCLSPCSPAVRQHDRKDMAVGVFVIGRVALFTGLLLTVLSNMSVVGPVRSVQEGMRRVRAGDNDVDLVVFDGSELGDLQVGFNTMVHGLRERERIQDLFGRHVGQDVAAAALRTDPELGGSEQIVATMFIDVIGSTTLAMTRTPTETVTILNRFFGVIVDAVGGESGDW